MNLSFVSNIYYPQLIERSQKPFLSTLFIFTFIFEVLINCLILANSAQKLSNHETTTLRVLQQKNTPDNFNIGVIHVKLKNWTTTRFPRIPNKFHFILNETDNLEQLNKRRRNNNEVGESRGRRTDGSHPNRGGSGSMEMDAIFPFLLLALGLALVAFFVILYAILNALLQRKDQHESERRRKRKRRKARRKRGWRNDNNDLIERGKQFENDEDNSSEEKQLDSLDEGSNDLAHPSLKASRRWHRSRDGQLSPLEVDDELMERNESDWMMTAGGMRRYRQHRATGSRRAPPPLPQLPPPTHEVPPRSRQLSQQHYPQHYARGQRHIGWANEDQISLPGILRSTPMPPPPPPPRVPPPAPPLPARYQKRTRRHPPVEPSIENSSDENDDQSSDGGNRRHRVYHKKRQDDEKRNPPSQLRRENTDSTISSLQRGGRAGSL